MSAASSLPAPPAPPTPWTLSNYFNDGKQLIFSFLELKELAQLMATDRAIHQFLSGAAAMKVHLRLRNVLRWGPIWISQSALRRRVTSLTLEDVPILARMPGLFPQLEEIELIDVETDPLDEACHACGFGDGLELDFALHEAVTWPQGLTKIKFTALGFGLGTQRLVEIISRLKSVTQLDLQMQFRIQTRRGGYSVLHYIDLSSLVALPHLHTLTSIDAQKWQRWPDPFTSGLVDLLPQLQHLRVLHLRWNGYEASFLGRLTQLTGLCFIDSSCRRGGLMAEHMLPQLRQLTCLTSLDLQCSKLTSDHLAQLLPHLPRLEGLSLVRCMHVGSSAFLATPSLANTLTTLRIVDCKMTHDMNHYATLRSLTHLFVCVDPPPTAAELLEWRRLRPRCLDAELGGRLLPQLVQFQLIKFLEQPSPSSSACSSPSP